MRNEKLKSTAAITILVCILICLTLFSFTTCNDPVFYEVSMQIKTPPPRIKGSPSAFVEINDILIVATARRIYYFDEISTYKPEEPDNNDRWQYIEVEASVGYISYIAKAGNRLYLLTDNGLFFKNISSALDFDAFSPGKIDFSNSYRHLFSMYSAYDFTRTSSMVFISARDYDGKHYFISCDNSGLVAEIPVDDEPIIYGAALDNSTYYLAAADMRGYNNRLGGIYYGNSSAMTLIPDDTGYGTAFTGIVSTGGSTVYAISRGGRIFDVTSTSVSQTSHSTGRLSSGGLFVYTVPGTSNRLLIAGRQDRLEYNNRTGYTYGYMEIPLDGNTIFSSGHWFREPGNISPSTLNEGRGNRERFRTTIGKNAIKHFYQAPNPAGTFFASTEINGVWSLKLRDDRSEPYWNTEE